jgi:hypothetical protein
MFIVLIQIFFNILVLMKYLFILVILCPFVAFSQDTLTMQDLRMNKFIAQRRDGKVLQVLGVLGMGAALLLNSQYQSDVSNRKPAKPVPTVIPIAATAAISLGIIIDITAGNHLKKKRSIRFKR